jgi:hypothetical protein
MENMPPPYGHRRLFYARELRLANRPLDLVLALSFFFFLSLSFFLSFSTFSFDLRRLRPGCGAFPRDQTRPAKR